ncbi:MAG: DNA-processing protein DprA [Gammaproteobacteria bacterium]
MTDLSWWLALVRAPDLSPQSARALLARHGSPRAVFESRALRHEPDWPTIERDAEWLVAPDHHFIPCTDDAYPTLLAQTDDAPLALFVVGEPSLLTTPTLAIVGSRNPTRLGLENAEAFASYLAGCGFTIVSGLALGVDAAAHRGALSAGRTIAVCATGLDEIYPRRNAPLARDIAQHGALVSEFPTGTGARVENFPRRNRIISGLSAGTLVIEAAVRSGSLITARLAAEQGREVFAIPGSIHNPLAKGCHYLIRQGAKLVDSAEHIVEELGPLLGLAGADAVSSRHAQQPHTAAFEADADYEKLLECLDETSTSIDRLVKRSGLTPDAVSSMLLIMELRGLVESAPGGGYARRQNGDLG